MNEMMISGSLTGLFAQPMVRVCPTCGTCPTCGAKTPTFGQQILGGNIQQAAQNR